MSQQSNPTNGSQSISMLNTLWDEIGYSDDEKAEKLRRINSDIEVVRSKFIESTVKQCQKVREETEQIRSMHISMLRAIGAPEEQIKQVNENGRKGTIKEKYDDVKSKYKEFSKLYKQKHSEFEKLQKQIDNCFAAMGITDPSQKGEFAEIGDKDLKPARLRRYEDKIKQLTNDVDSRLLQFISFKKQILTMNSDLQEELPPEIENIFSEQIYSDPVLEKLKNFASDLKNLLNTRRQYISEMAVEINRLWDLLGVDELTRRQFLASHNNLSQKNVQDCIDEADRLTKIRNQRLPEIIEQMKLDLKKICKSLGYSKQKEKDICYKCEQVEEDSDNFEKTEKDQKENTNDKPDINEEEDINNEPAVNEEEEENINVEPVKNEEENADDEPAINEEEENADDEPAINEEEENADDEPAINEEEENADDEPILNEEEEKNIDVEPSLNDKEENTNNELVINDNKEEEETNIENVDPNLLQIFNNFSNELVHLKKTLIFAQPIIDLINQREQIIKDYNEVMNKPEKASEANDIQLDNPEAVKIKRYDQLNGKGIKLKIQRVQLPDHKEKLRSEKVIRRHKFVLPRIEKKLYIMLIQYREEQKGEDFIWKDKPLIDELGPIQVTQDEINQNRVRFNKIKKRLDMNNETDMDGDAIKSPSKHRKSMFVNHDKMEPKKDGENTKKSRSPRKSALPKRPKKIVDE